MQNTPKYISNNPICSNKNIFYNMYKFHKSFYVVFVIFVFVYIPQCLIDVYYNDRYINDFLHCLYFQKVDVRKTIAFCADVYGTINIVEGHTF